MRIAYKIITRFCNYEFSFKNKNLKSKKKKTNPEGIYRNGILYRYQQLVILNGREETFLRDWLAAIIFLSLQLFINYLFAVCFGAMATLLNPMRTWSLLIAVYLWLKVMNRTQSAWDLICWFNAKFMALIY